MLRVPLLLTRVTSELCLFCLSLRASASAKMCLPRNTRPGFIKAKCPRLGRTIPPDATTFAPKPVSRGSFLLHIIPGCLHDKVVSKAEGKLVSQKLVAPRNAPTGHRLSLLRMSYPKPYFRERMDIDDASVLDILPLSRYHCMLLFIIGCHLPASSSFPCWSSELETASLLWCLYQPALRSQSR